MRSERTSSVNSVPAKESGWPRGANVVSEQREYMSLRHIQTFSLLTSLCFRILYPL